MKKVVSLLSIAVLGLVVSVRSYAASPDASMQFTVLAALDAANIYAATMESVSGQDADVVDFAQRELLRYTQLTARLSAYAADKGIEIISLEQAVSDMTILQTAQLVYGSGKTLANLSGADLDKAFLKEMVKIDSFAIATLNAGIARLQNTEEGKFLSGISAQIQESLTSAQRLNKTLNAQDME